MLVYAIRPKLAFVELWYAQNPAPALKPSGWVPVGLTTTYWAFRFGACVVLPKCCAPRTASCAIWAAVAWFGAAAAVSVKLPANTLPVNFGCWPAVPQLTVPRGTPWQYCEVTRDQESCVVPRPFTKFCR